MADALTSSCDLHPPPATLWSLLAAHRREKRKPRQGRGREPGRPEEAGCGQKLDLDP